MSVFKGIDIKKIITPKPYDIIGSIISGFTCALVYLNYRFYILQFTPRRLLFYFGIYFILFTLASYLFLFRLSIPKLDTFPKLIKPVWIGSSILFGLLLAYVFSFSYKTILSWHRLEVSPLSPQPMAEIQIIEIKINDGNLSFLHEFPNMIHYPYMDNFPIASSTESNHIIYDFWAKSNDELTLLFQGQQHTFPIDINLDGVSTELDLYKPGGERYISITVKNQNLSNLFVFFLYAIDSVAFCLAVLFISIWLWFI